jgi:hypothetical protein
MAKEPVKGPVTTLPGVEEGKLISMPPIGENEPDEDPPKVDPAVEAMTKQIEELTAINKSAAEREERYMAMNEQLITSRSPAAPSTPAPAVVPTLENMPDPTLEPAKFQEAIATHIKAATEQAVAPIRQEASTQGRLSDLWTRFGKHTEMSPYADLLQAEVHRRATEASARGANLEALMFGDPDGFVESVVKTVADRVEKISGKRPGEEAKEKVPGQREAGIDGGSGPIVGGKDGKKEPKKPPTFVEQIRKLQRDSGMY